MSDITESDLDVLRDRLPPVVDAFEHFTYIGSGTFSKVYMANIRKRPSSKVAIKVITPTSDPSRVFREINFLRKSDGKNNIIPILTSFIHPECGTCAIVMPFIKHRPFGEYYNKLTLAQIRIYTRALLLSLGHLHKLNILHRDIKPPNFLFDPESGSARLVDFGLSEEVTPKDLRESNHITHSRTFSCRCNVTQVCTLCTTQKRSMKASRAGTGGFRPPEVLLKSQKQDQKIDVWAAGVCFIVLLSRRYPYFPAVDDNLALSHIAALLGSAGLRDAAASMGRKLTTAQVPEAAIGVQQYVRKQRLTSTQACEEDEIETRSDDWREATDLLVQLLQPNPKNRPNACQALEMAFLRDKTKT